MDAVLAPGVLFGFAVERDTLVLVGELDIVEVPPFARAVRRLLSDGVAGDVTVDVQNLRFCDASGLRVLAKLATGLPDGCHVVLRGARPQLRRRIEISGLDELIVVQPLSTAAS